MTPKISMVHPNYNHAKLLSGSIEGVLAQTYGNWELIIVDDGSTDDSWAVLERYARKDDRIRLERFPTNGGIMRTVAHGMTKCTGELFYPRASDVPIVSPRFFERAIDGLRRYPGAGIVFALTNGIDASGKVVAKWGAPAEPREHIDQKQAVREFFLSDYVAGESAILDRKRLLELGAYDPALGPWQDVFVNSALVALYGGIYVDEVVTHTQLDPGSFSRRQTVTAMIEFAARMEKKFRELPLRVPPRREWIVHYRERKLVQALMHGEQQSLASTLEQLAANLANWPANRQPGYLPSLKATLGAMVGVIREESNRAARDGLALYDSIAGPIPDA